MIDKIHLISYLRISKCSVKITIYWKNNEFILKEHPLGSNHTSTNLTFK